MIKSDISLINWKFSLINISLSLINERISLIDRSALADKYEVFIDQPLPFNENGLRNNG